MRKDAKIGFAIGGVLLAVLTVYVLVVPSHKRSRTINGVTLEVPPGTAGGTADTPTSVPPTAVSTDAKADQPAADAKPVVARNDGVNWEKILGGTSDAPTLKTTTPAATDTPAAPTTPDPAIATNTAPATEMPLAAVTPMASTPMAAVSPSTQPTGSRTYTIKPGQTLSLIAAEIYGNSRFYVAIKRANPNIDANHLKPGMRITLPDISDVKPDALVKVGENGAAVSTGKTYKVQSGDTLYRISKSLYGSGRQAEALYELNRDLIGPDKARLKLGMVLRLPVSPVAGATASSR
jgi:nucleoid-associated protein YgaU